MMFNRPFFITHCTLIFQASDNSNNLIRDISTDDDGSSYAEWFRKAKPGGVGWRGTCPTHCQTMETGGMQDTVVGSFVVLCILMPVAPSSYLTHTFTISYLKTPQGIVLSNPHLF